jgi:hypothetical protein
MRFVLASSRVGVSPSWSAPGRPLLAITAAAPITVVKRGDNFAGLVGHNHDDVAYALHDGHERSAPEKLGNAPVADAVSATAVPRLEIDVGILEYEIHYFRPDRPLLCASHRMIREAVRRSVHDGLLGSSARIIVQECIGAF